MSQLSLATAPPKPVSAAPQSRQRRLAGSVSPRASIIAKLNAEWDQIEHQSADWTDQPTRASDLLAGIADDPDKALLHLIGACQAGHPLAGRIVLQAFLGKMVRLNRAHPHIDLTELVSALWLRIATYPIDRRPRAVAANLALDTLSDCLRTTRPLGRLLPAHPDRMTASTVLAAAEALGLVSPNRLAVVAAVYSPDGGARRVAEQYQISPEAVRRRCCDTIACLRRARLRLYDYLTDEAAWVCHGDV